MSDDLETLGGDDTRLTATATQSEAATLRRVPGLTLLAHPDPARTGEVFTFPSLALGRSVSLSRLQPAFRSPASPCGFTPRDTAEDAGRPLDERTVSRKPILLTPGAELGSLSIDVRETSTPVIADGEQIEEVHTFSEVDLDRGVVLLVGRHIALLLHRMTFPAAERPASDLGLIGESDMLVDLRNELLRLAPLGVPVLLRGESGTGKELAARALHEGGPHSSGPWVAVNMATLTPTLAASELFGAVRGAYTGADRAKDGFFQSAAGGTLFLDEIGEAPIETQAMLLRALESREIVPVGAAAAVPIDVRVIAATDARLEVAIAEGRFRAPLYHRLAGYSIRLPPLRDRRDDVPRLLRFFLDLEASELGLENRLQRLPAKTVARLTQHDWPGNVRELRNLARRLLILAQSSSPRELDARTQELLDESTAAEALISSSASFSPPNTSASSVSERADDSSPPRRTLRKPSEVSEEELREALQTHRWKVSAVADALRLSRTNLYRLIDDSPWIRKASELDRQEIEAVLAGCDGDLEAAAVELEVSLRGLKRRRTELGLETS